MRRDGCVLRPTRRGEGRHAVTAQRQGGGVDRVACLRRPQPCQTEPEAQWVCAADARWVWRRVALLSQHDGRRGRASHTTTEGAARRREAERQAAGNTYRVAGAGV